MQWLPAAPALWRARAQHGKGHHGVSFISRPDCLCRGREHSVPLLSVPVTAPRQCSSINVVLPSLACRVTLHHRGRGVLLCTTLVKRVTRARVRAVYVLGAHVDQ